MRVLFSALGGGPRRRGQTQLEKPVSVNPWRDTGGDFGRMCAHPRSLVSNIIPTWRREAVDEGGRDDDSSMDLYKVGNASGDTSPASLPALCNGEELAGGADGEMGEPGRASEAPSENDAPRSPAGSSNGNDAPCSPAGPG